MKALTFNSFICLLFIMALFASALGLFLYVLNPEPLRASLSLFQEPQSFVKLIKMLKHLAIGGMVFTLFTFVLFYRINKNSFYQVRLEPSLKATIHPKAISSFLDHFFKTKQPDFNLPYKVKVKRKNVEVILDCSKQSIQAEMRHLRAWEKELYTEFEKQCGAPKSLTFSILCNKT